MKYKYIPNEIEKIVQTFWMKKKSFDIDNMVIKKNIIVYLCFHIRVENYI